ncbi:hypothetical protein OUZ56_016449 [Daphnia magna]|uniref:Uncharacterized protein n=1 Tax=Daphnia magna TaxID=35525 RepID=A0ABR0AQZ0_9CRUS|nr:hypothetical protein OUZ56_016449 [Daphnia magna]
MSPSSIRERTTSSNIQLTVTTVGVLSQYPKSSGSWLNIHLFSDFIIGLSLHRLDCLIISHSTTVVSMAMRSGTEPSENWRSPTPLGLLQSHVVIWNAFVEESSRSSVTRVGGGDGHICGEQWHMAVY